MKLQLSISRRFGLKGIGLLGVIPFLHPGPAFGSEAARPDTLPAVSGAVRKEIFRKVFAAPLIDTHEHLFDEKERLAGNDTPDLLCDDWAVSFFPYLCDDMMVAGMSQDEWSRFFSRKIDPLDKWKILEPYWPVVKNTGYGRAVCISFQKLYHVNDLSSKTIKAVQAGYERVRKPGFYKFILQDLGGIESCQVNYTAPPFKETSMPALLMQDLSILGMLQGPEFEKYAGPAGITVGSLEDWHRVMEWWFNKYEKYAVAVKSQNAYSRDINYDRVPPEKVEGVFKKVREKQPVAGEEKKALEDHLFWHAVDRATKAGLPVKLHTGYYVGHDYMPLGRPANNPDSASSLCRTSPETAFVFMHLCYPHYEQMLALAKHYTNAYLDMCWGWIINPIAAKDFLKKFLVTVPVHKIFTFGGDTCPVEQVLGHAIIARQGIALALSELVEEGWLPLKNAMDMIDPIMHENARKVFRLEEKKKILEKVPWG
jgi:predicted TIM-barrel fold metal-dependent hydrolase